MEQQGIPYRKHILVCTHERDGECCSRKGSLEIAEGLKKEVADRGLRMDVKVTRTSCLGFCLKGPNVMMYPKTIIKNGVRKEDATSIVDEALDS